MSDLRNTGDAWVTAPDGNRYWGRFGAAGLIAHDSDRGILLQHRVSWSDHGGTWGIPGGALNEHETALEGAFREANEEASVPQHGVFPRFTHVLDREVWTYTTVIAHVAEAFEPVITDAESHELRWVPRDKVRDYPLHPAFAASWPKLEPLLDLRTVLIIDAANVVGSTPNGWWNNRLGATKVLQDRLVSLSRTGAPSSLFSFHNDIGHLVARTFPRIILVTEGQARQLQPVPGVEVVPAPGSGDDTIIAVASFEEKSAHHVTVVTSDRGLRERAIARGAHVLSVSALHAALSAPDQHANLSTH